MEQKDRTKTVEYYLSHPIKEVRKKSSPRVNSFDNHVMRKAEQIRKQKGIHERDVLPMFDARYYKLLRDGDRKIYNMQIYLLSIGLGVSIDDLIKGYNG
jgi:hypothetical protein